jgi:hypothetical protein
MRKTTVISAFWGFSILALILTGGIILADSLDIRPGESRLVTVRVVETDGQSFTMTDGYYWILDQNGSYSQETETATIAGDTLSGMANAGGWTADSEYSIFFTTEITESPGEVFIWPVTLNCTEDGI